MTYIPLKLEAGAVVDGCTDTTCGHWVGSPHYSGPYTLEIERAICAWASMFRVEQPEDALIAALEAEWHNPKLLENERVAR